MTKYLICQAKRFACLSLIAIFAVTLSSFSSRHNNPTEGEGMKASIFKTYTGMEAFFGQDFDFDFKCSIQSYELIYQPKQNDPVAIANNGGSFSPEIRKAVQKAKAGDMYVFREIKARCPGDSAARSLPAIVVIVK